MADQTTIPPDLVRDLWSAIKGQRDEAVGLGRDRLASELDCLLARMKAAGMSAHLPTVEEMAGMWAHAGGYTRDDGWG